MAAVQAMTGSGGWPMSRLPDARTAGRSSAAPTSQTSRATGCRRSGRCSRASPEPGGKQRAQVEAAGGRLAAGPGRAGPAARRHGRPDGRRCSRPRRRRSRPPFDPANGGWGRAPKFPQPMTVEYLLRRHLATGDSRPLAIARRTLDAMADGGIHDQLGGGFHRYATDARWLVPHFEQMLYDNAQLARVYLHAWQLTGDERYRAVATGTLDYLLRELMTAGRRVRGQPGRGHRRRRGAHASPGGSARSARCSARMRRSSRPPTGSPTTGNWEGVTILSRVMDDDDLAGRDDLAGGRPGRRPRPGRTWRPDRRRRRRATGRRTHRLLERRGLRPQPGRDDKALAAWNGLAIAAFAEASAALDGIDPATAARYRDAARAAAATIVEGLVAPDGVPRPVLEGRPRGGHGRARGLHASRRRPPGPLRGDLRRTLVRHRAWPRGPRAGPFHRSRWRLLRHRRRRTSAWSPAPRTSRTTPSRRATRWPPWACSACTPGPARAPIARPRNVPCARSFRSWPGTRRASHSG